MARPWSVRDMMVLSGTLLDPLFSIFGNQKMSTFEIYTPGPKKVHPLDPLYPFRKQVNRRVVHPNTVHQCALSELKIMVDGVEDHSVMVWSVYRDEDMCDPFVLDDTHTSSAAFSHDGRHIAYGSIFGGISVWDVAQGTRLHHMARHSFNCKTMLSFSPDDRYLASITQDATCQIWSVEDGTLCREYDANSVVWSPTNDGSDKWTIQASKIKHNTQLHETETSERVLTVDCGKVVSCDGDHSMMYIRNVPDDGTVHKIRSVVGKPIAARFLSGGEYLMCVYESRNIITCIHSRYMVSEEILDCICAAYNLPGGKKRRWGPFAEVDKLLTRWELKKPSGK